MNQSEKEMILVKLQELTNIIQGITCKEETLFDHEEENPILQPVQEQETIQTGEKPRRTRVRAKDGTMTASTFSNETHHVDTGRKGHPHPAISHPFRRGDCCHPGQEQTIRIWAGVETWTPCTKGEDPQGSTHLRQPSQFCGSKISKGACP